MTVKTDQHQPPAAVKRAYKKPALQRLGLLRRLTRFSF
jgi:hypothetical protein